jgi:hypothetical protein
MQRSEEIFNPKNDDPPPLSRQALNEIDTSHIDPGASGSDDALTLLLEGEAYAQQEVNKRNPNSNPLPMSTPIRLRYTKEILAGLSNPPILAPGRCVIPTHHNGYYSFIDCPEACPYKGDHKGAILSGEHA